jgi:hypothetical protein
MSGVSAPPQQQPSAEYRTPEKEQAERGTDIRPAQDLPLEDIKLHLPERTFSSFVKGSTSLPVKVTRK